MGKYLLKVEERPGGGGLPTRVGTHVTAQAGSVEVSAVGTGLDVGRQLVVSVSSFLQPVVSSSVSGRQGSTGADIGKSGAVESKKGDFAGASHAVPSISGFNT